jgi:hypothetical protein
VNGDSNNIKPVALIEASQALDEKIKAFRKDWYKRYKNISKEKTPQVDGSGRKIIDKRPDGLDYIIDAYMDECLDKHFPGWSWKRAGGLQFLGSEWVSADGELYIIDERLLALNIVPPYRVFWGCGAARIQYKKGAPHTPENTVDIDKNVKAANTNAKKVAINRLTGIGDDVYAKRIEEEGAGSLEEVVMMQGDATSFGRWVSDSKLKWSEVFQILGVKGMDGISDYKEAIGKIKTAKGWK